MLYRSVNGKGITKADVKNALGNTLVWTLPTDVWPSKRTKAILVAAETEDLWIRAGGDTLAGDDVVTSNESTTAMDHRIPAGDPPHVITLPGSTTKVAVRAASASAGAFFGEPVIIP